VKFFPWLMVLFVGGFGCSTSRDAVRYAPSNVHSVQVMPQALRRVALLQVATHRGGGELRDGRESLATVMETELRKCAAFEVVPVSEANLRAWTGRSVWGANEALPQDLIVRIRSETGCDAILLSSLTALHSYPPLSLGLKLKLIDGADHPVVWAVEEVIDAGFKPVARAARDYARTNTGDEKAILQSPTRFAHFASATLFRTLPQRENRNSPAQTLSQAKADSPPRSL
jgi:hypothetical protein